MEIMEIIDNDMERTFILNKDLESNYIKQYEVEFNRFIQEDTRDVIVDLKYVMKIDSMSIAALIRIKKKLQENNRTLKIINPNEGVLRILDISGLETYLMD